MSESGELQKGLLELAAKMRRDDGEGTTYDWVPTCGHAGQRHPRGLVGFLWRIKDPATVRLHGFWEGRIKPGDLVICLEHSGDCFQTYMLVHEERCSWPIRPEDPTVLTGKPSYTFGSYGIGDAEKIDFPEECIAKLKAGGRVGRCRVGCETVREDGIVR